jgi:hypothetical protein
MRSKKRTIHARKTIALVVDGHTEYWYFNMLKRNERDSASYKQHNLNAIIEFNGNLSELREKFLVE